MKKTIAFLLALLLQTGLAQTKTKPKFGNYEMITQSQMRDYLEFIASDELEGRDTPSKGLDIAAKFIATNLSRWGVEPAGDDGTYFQKIEMKHSRAIASETTATLNGKVYNYGEDFIFSGESADLDANLCFAGHGWYIPSQNINPYEKLDIKDKFVIVYEGFPKGISLRDSRKFSTDFMPPAMYAAKHGAKGVIYIPGYQSLAFWQRLSQNAIEKGSTTFVEEGTISIPQIVISVRLFSDLFQGEKVPAHAIFNNATPDIEPFTLSPQKRLRLSLRAKTEKIYTKNVLGIVRGSDPKLNHEYVALGAHYDHVGIGNPIGEDAIYNGADDDGSGTVALMAMAEAFAKGIKPKRSLLFVWHTAEEKGLRGSKHFVEHPTVPLQQIVAQLNIDMIGRSRVENDKTANQNLSGKDEVYVIGSKMLSSELGNLNEQVNSSFLKLTFNYKYDDPADPNRFFYRSDHYNYAKKGIPVIFYFTGVHEDYHRPSDHVEKIDFDKMEKITRTIYATALELGNRPTRPSIDKQLNIEQES